MTIYSFIENGNRLTPVEIELELWPGLPDIIFIGGADQHLKESAKRIRSAIRAQGFDFLQNHQALVNLKPSYIKKSSRGLELAVAMAYLIATKQIQMAKISSSFKSKATQSLYAYGELSLDGHIQVPIGFENQLHHDALTLVTGTSEIGFYIPTWQAQELRQLKNHLHSQPPQREYPNWSPPPEILEIKINPDWARLLGACSLGQVHVLMAGASGAGKTTAARILHALLPTPSLQEQHFLLSHSTLAETCAQPWRPYIQPHHTIPLNSLIGGGSQAHGG